MGREERKALIRRLETLRQSRVISYVTGDRAPVPAQISDDVLRPLYEILRSIGHVPRLDLFIYSRGGAIDTPWRIVHALRRYSDEWNILVPFRANSAATLIALGADTIILGAQGELGPIDPQMTFQRQGTAAQDQVSVEDVMAYVKFVQEKAGLSEQQALSTSLARLTERIDAVGLGSVYRTHSHIRDVARRILTSRKTPPGEDALTAIVQTLAERVYAHGHAITFKDAHDIGLAVQAADAETDEVMWQLLNEYESFMRLRDPLDPASAVATTDVYREETAIAAVESSESLHAFTGRIEIRAKRSLPQQLSVNLNLNLQLPQGFDPNALTQESRNVLQQLLNQAQQLLAQQAQQSVQQAMQNQAPLTGADIGFREGRWKVET